MLVTLRADTVEFAVNKIFLAYNKIPKASEHDFIGQVSFSANQEIVVPAIHEGSYYLLLEGNHPAKKIQTVKILAKIIPFATTNVHSNKGGNTGAVTIKINGARFESNTSFKLQSTTLGLIRPVKVYYIDGTQVYATFNLTNEKTGMYNVVATQLNDDSARLVNGFEIVQGPGSSSAVDGPGGGGAGGGFVCKVVNVGFEDQMEIDVEHPSSTRLNRYLTITIYFENRGSVDLPVPTRYLVSLNKAVPVSASLDSIRKIIQDRVSEFSTQVALEFEESDGPRGILRPQANGFIKVYTYSSVLGRLDFVIEE